MICTMIMNSWHSIFLKLSSIQLYLVFYYHLNTHTKKQPMELDHMEDRANVYKD